MKHGRGETYLQQNSTNIIMFLKLKPKSSLNDIALKNKMRLLLQFITYLQIMLDFSIV